MSKPILTQKRLRELFTYSDGELLWRSSRGCIRAGSVAGYKMPTGYFYVGVDGQNHYLHRLIWFFFNGQNPKHTIDHINHDKGDNRIENLRDVTQKVNSRNMGNVKQNSLGFAGVTFNKRDNRWLAKIKVDYKQIYLGQYETLEEAISMRMTANDHYGFSNDHGSFRYIY